MAENQCNINLHDLFKHSAHVHHNKIAVEYFAEDFIKKSLTYKQLCEVSAIVQEVVSNTCGISQDASHSISNLVEINNSLKSNGTCVGLFVKTDIFLIGLLIGILQANCHFAPLNVDSPATVNINFVKNAGLSLVITSQSLNSQFLESFSSFKCIVAFAFSINISNSLEEKFILYRLLISDLPHDDFQAKDYSLAYILSTSGTTGQPKVVCVPHRSIVPNVIHLSHIFSLSPSDKLIMCSPLTFDPSIVEIFVALTSGATLMMVQESVKLKPDKFAELLFTISNVTVMQMTPTLFNSFKLEDLRERAFAISSSLRILAFGGEAAPTCKTIRNWFDEKLLAKKLPKVRFFNLYGITEVSSWATWYEIPAEDLLLGSERNIPLGEPLLDTALDIVTNNDELICHIESSYNFNSVLLQWRSGLPVPKKLNPKFSLVTKNFLAENDVINVKGYLKIGSRKRKCYVKNSYDKSVMKLSGDLVELRLKCKTPPLVQAAPEGSMTVVLEVNVETFELHYAGRTDHQIKRQGKRMNKLALKQCLEKVTFVLAAHVVDIDIRNYYGSLLPLDWTASHENNRFFNNRLVAFVVLDQGHESSYKKCLTDHVKRSLEAHYIPDDVIPINKLPVTSHGKVDELLLIDYFKNEIQLKDSPVASFRDWRSVLLQCLNEVLVLDKDTLLQQNASKLDFDEINFVNYGGDSFSAVKLVEMLRKRMHQFGNFSVEDARLLHVVLHGTFGEVLKLIPNASSEHSVMPQPDIKQPKRKRDQINQISKVQAHNWVSDETSDGENTSQICCFSLSRGNVTHCHGHTPHENLIQQCPGKRFKPDKDLIDASHDNLSLSKVWSFNTKKCVDASPLIVFSTANSQEDGYAIIGSHSHLLVCLTLAKGEVKWKSELGDRIESSACLSPCGGYIVVGCYDHFVYMLSVCSGQIIHKFKTGNQVKSSPCPGQPGSSLVFIGSHDGHLLCFDVKKRTVCWSYQTRGGSVFSSPCYYTDPIKSDSGIVVGCSLSGQVFSLDAESGKEKWSVKLAKPVFSSPRACKEGVCVGCVDNTLYMLAHLSGETLWKYTTTQPIFSSPAIVELKDLENDNPSPVQMVVFSSHDGKTYCLKSTDGTPLWCSPSENPLQEKLSPVYATPFPVHVDIDSKAFGIVVIATTDGDLKVLHLRDGRCLTQRRLPGHVFSSPVVVQRHDHCDVIVGCRNDNVYCFRMKSRN